MEFTEQEKELLYTPLPENPCDECSYSISGGCGGCGGCHKLKIYLDSTLIYRELNIFETARQIESIKHMVIQIAKLHTDMDFELKELKEKGIDITRILGS